jgi:hypothetical protein
VVVSTKVIVGTSQHAIQVRGSGSKRRFPHGGGEAADRRGNVSAWCFEGMREGARRLQRFFTLWKDADPDIPILVAAKSEYAALH